MNRQRMFRREQICSEIKTGHVAVPEDFIAVQNYADQGSNRWRLNPLESARRVGIYHLGFSPNDAFTFHSYYRDFGSGLQHALVLAVHGPCHFVINLYQPVKQGATGIWAVQRVTRL